MKKILLATGLAMFWMTGVANATLLSFSDRAVFESQLETFQVLNFNDFAYRATLPPNFSYGDTILNAAGGIYISGSNFGGYADGYRAGAENWGVILIQLLPGHKAFGLDISYLEDRDSEERLAFTLSGSGGLLATSSHPAPLVQKNGTFFGWISTDQDIIGLSVHVFVPGISSCPAIDNITYDIPAPPSTPDPVPEPATMLLMGTGVAGLVGARRKKKA